MNQSTQCLGSIVPLAMFSSFFKQRSSKIFFNQMGHFLGCLKGFCKICKCTDLESPPYRGHIGVMAAGSAKLIVELPRNLTSFRIISSEGVCSTFLMIAINAVN